MKSGYEVLTADDTIEGFTTIDDAAACASAIATRSGHFADVIDCSTEVIVYIASPLFAGAS